MLLHEIFIISQIQVLNHITIHIPVCFHVLEESQNVKAKT